MLERSAIIAALPLLLWACNDDTGKQCPPCGTNMVCDSASGVCVQAVQCTSPATCGANADCANSLCACSSGFNDCNKDLGQAGGDGCECSQSCNGAICGSSSGCSADVAHACNSASLYCDASICRPCAAGMFNCDGVGTCESTGACTGVGCSVDVFNSCGDKDYFCDAGKCQPCPAGMHNCNGTGPCESNEVCDAPPQTCIENAVHDCEDQNLYCGNGICTPCAPGTFNCDGTNACECDSPCNAAICNDLSKMSCVDLEIAYGELIGEALECDATLSTEQCTKKMYGGVKCRCELFVNPANSDAIHKLEAMLAVFDSKACQTGCPPVAQCSEPTGAECKASSSGGTCRLR